MKKVHIYHYHHARGKLSHQIYLPIKIGILFCIPIILTIFIFYYFAVPLPIPRSTLFENNLGLELTWGTLFSATLMTTLRIFYAYVISVIVALLLALLVTSSERVERILLPIFDVIESVPVIAFFPLIILAFIKWGFISGAAIFMLTINMLWSIVFTVVGGIKLIPQTIRDTAALYNIRGFQYVRHILFPSIIPELITGSMLAVAAGWDVVIVAEVLHVYIPNGTPASDLFGIGSILVNASTAGNQELFVLSILCMTIVIALTNIFIWQRLLKLAEKYRFE